MRNTVLTLVIFLFSIAFTFSQYSISTTSSDICIGQTSTLSVVDSNNQTISLNGSNLQILQTGLIGFWPFNGNADDEVNNNNGIVSGASLSNDRFDNANSAYFFNDVYDRISINFDQDFESNEISFSFWIKPSSINSTNYSTIIKKGAYQSAQEEAFIFSLRDDAPNGTLETAYKNSTCTPSAGWLRYYHESNTNLIDSWNHYLITIDSNNTQKVYPKETNLP